MKHGKHYREEKKTVLTLLEKLFGKHIHEEKGPSVPSYRRRVW